MTSEKLLNFYTPRGFWQSMDTLMEEKILYDTYIQNKSTWKIWQK